MIYIHLRNLIILTSLSDLHLFKESYHFKFVKMIYIHLMNLIIRSEERRVGKEC